MTLLDCPCGGVPEVADMDGRVHESIYFRYACPACGKSGQRAFTVEMAANYWNDAAARNFAPVETKKRGKKRGPE